MPARKSERSLCHKAILRGTGKYIAPNGAKNQMHHLVQTGTRAIMPQWGDDATQLGDPRSRPEPDRRTSQTCRQEDLRLDLCPQIMEHRRRRLGTPAPRMPSSSCLQRGIPAGGGRATALVLLGIHMHQHVQHVRDAGLHPLARAARRCGAPGDADPRIDPHVGIDQHPVGHAAGAQLVHVEHPEVPSTVSRMALATSGGIDPVSISSRSAP